MLWAQWVMTVALGMWWLWWMSVALMVMLNWLDDVEVANRWAGVRVIVGCTLCAVLFTLFCAWIVVQFIWMQCVALCG